ncbi:MAG: HoxN/HupN/NixA family nickel/cobalt transporter [Solirubrobacteraceae bacterium]
MEASTLSAARVSRSARFRGALTPSEWRRAGAMATVIAALHIVGFAILVLVVAPQRLRLGTTGTFAIGTGITAYTLGLRHAFDADHISAIDNVTRKLMSEGKRPLSVGFFFSLGHATVVFVLALLLALGFKSLSGPLQSPGSTLHSTTNLIGTTVSGTFLYLIAALNIAILISIVRIFRDARRGVYDEQALERQLDARGLMSRLFGRRLDRVREPWQIYPVGVLFGLGFDTATEVALLVLAGSAGAAGLPFYAILCLPVLFAAGMSLLDTIDGSFMNFAYGWAFSKPVRKLYYNITITGLSIAVALFIGTIELAGLMTRELHLSGAFVAWLQDFDVNRAGFIIAGMFVATWAIAIAVWHLARVEDRWSAGIERAAAQAAPRDTAP